MPFQLLFENPALFLAWIAAIIIGITVHEFSHVFAAYIQGDSTGKDMGRLNLNPLSHIDPLGIALLVFVGFGWGKPAPFNPYNLRNPKLGSVLVAFAGPISNLVVVVLLGLAFHFVLPIFQLTASNLLVIFVIFLIQINLVLMAFNLLPFPPLDGSRLVTILIPDRYATFKMAFERYSPMLLFVLLFSQIILGSSFLGGLFNWVNTVAERILTWQ